MANSNITVFPLPVGAEVTRGRSVYSTWGEARRRRGESVQIE